MSKSAPGFSELTQTVREVDGWMGRKTELALSAQIRTIETESARCESSSLNKVDRC